MSFYPDLFASQMQTLLTLVQNRLTSDNRSVGLAYLAPGYEVAWDNCCDSGGQLYVRAAKVAAITNNNDLSQMCGVNRLEGTFAVGIVRCAHTIGNQGQYPDAADITADSNQVTLDASTLFGVLECEFRPKVVGLKLDFWTPVGPSGGCVGGEWFFRLSNIPCGCGGH